MLGSMEVVVAFLVLLSLAAERLVTIVKTAFPWLDREQLTSDLAPDPYRDRSRRLAVQSVAFSACYVTAAVTTGTYGPFQMSKIGDYAMPLWGIALLASGGSAFWSSVLGYTRAAKDAQQAMQRSRQLHVALESAQLDRQAGTGSATNSGVAS